MPELPEVQTMVDWLNEHVRMGKMIVGAKVFRGKNYLADGAAQALRGNSFYAIRRVGKFIVFDLDRAKMVAHNAMSGYWDTEAHPWCFNYVEGKREPMETDVRVTIGLGDFTVIRFHDPRLFGSLKLYSKILNFADIGIPSEFDDQEIPCLARLGPDIMLQPDAAVVSLIAEAAKHPRRMIKDALLDQAVVSGCGNIYASEVLFQTKIIPDRKIGLLRDNEFQSVIKQLGVIFDTAVQEKLDYTKYLKIYRKENCPDCGNQIFMVKIKSRSSYFCFKCQE